MQKAGETLNSFVLKNDIEPAILSSVEDQKQDIKLNVFIKIARDFNKRQSEFLTEYENVSFSNNKILKKTANKCGLFTKISIIQSVWSNSNIQ